MHGDEMMIISGDSLRSCDSWQWRFVSLSISDLLHLLLQSLLSRLRIEEEVEASQQQIEDVDAERLGRDSIGVLGSEGPRQKSSTPFTLFGFSLLSFVSNENECRRRLRPLPYRKYRWARLNIWMDAVSIMSSLVVFAMG